MSTADQLDRTATPRDVHEIEHVWIPMSDGCRLAARIWLPVDAETEPVPAVLEYIPYRKNDGTAQRDRQRQPELAAYGYAAVRVDVRGSGDSEGFLTDEYTQQELDDAYEVIAWLAEQSWCTGKVGMTGISWGGFNALQVAALQPPALEAVISICSTDDRYADDVHYYGGCVLGSEMLSWASTMLMAGARPPDPKHVGDGWRETWLERLDVEPFVASWLRHQRRDDFWRHGSVCEDLDAMQCAVYMVGGWDDAYRDAILRVLAGYSGPRKGLIGPWGHTYPDSGAPGDPIDFVAESVRFWEKWLKGVDTGVMDEPMLRAFVREPDDDGPFRTERAGAWVSEPTWPSPSVTQQRWEFGPGGGLAPRPGGRDASTNGTPGAPPDRLLGCQTTGLEAGTYMGFGLVEDLPGDQRREDGTSLCYTSAPLEEPLTVLGQASVGLDLAVDQPDAIVAVRLCEVTATGASRLVARGLLNLTHRHDHAEPVAMVPGERTQVSVDLSAAGYTFSAGGRIRVAVSPTYWPWAWPSPAPVTLSVYPGGDSALSLPVRAAQEGDGQLPSFIHPTRRSPDVPTAGGTRLIDHDQVTGRSELVTVSAKDVAIEDGLRLAESRRDAFAIVEGDPLSAEARSERSSQLTRGRWGVRVETVSTMTADATTFRVTNAIDAYEGATRVASRRWTHDIPRDHV